MAMLIPAFVPHPDHRPASLIGIAKLTKRGHGQLELHGERVALEKAFHGMMIGLIPKFSGEDTDDFAGMDRGIELFDREHVGGDRVGIDMALPPCVPRALIDETQHALHEEPTDFVAHHRPFDSCLATAFRNGFRKEDYGPNDFIIVLNVVNELELILHKILCRRHTCPPSPARETPAPPGERLREPGPGPLPLCDVRCDGRIGVIMGGTRVLSSLPGTFGRVWH
jgi:hypothetical protein